MENTRRNIRLMGLTSLVLGLSAASYEVFRWYDNPTSGRTLTYEQAQIENAHTIVGLGGLFFAVVGALVTYATFSDSSSRATPYRGELTG